MLYLDVFLFFFFTDTSPTEIYTLSLHDALPICHALRGEPSLPAEERQQRVLWHRCNRLLDRRGHVDRAGDRKSTRLNSSHITISYAVFCLKKKKKIKTITRTPTIHTNAAHTQTT